ncbi:Cobalt transport protein [Butyrivibrio fibrisolvens 16/4]|nr:Cobalt transport protein [Butyrivibrio fibrisolvens 16/4]
MLREITLGQYYPAESILHSLDPRVKLFGTLIFIITLFSANNVVLFAAVLITLIGIIRMSHVPFLLW